MFGGFKGGSGLLGMGLPTLQLSLSLFQFESMNIQECSNNDETSHRIAEEGHLAGFGKGCKP